MPEFHPPQNRAEADPRRWIALTVLMVANFMIMIDVTIVNVALPRLQTNLGATSSQIEWIVAGYILAFAVGLLPFGRLGDIVGRKRMFLIGVAGFTVGSAICGLAPSIEWLVAARILQGFAGAILTPQVLSIVQVIFPPQERGLAFSFFGLSAGLASVAGPIAGGLLISSDLWGLDWRPIFLINLPIGIFALIAGQAFVTRVPPHPGLKNDFLGILVFGFTVVLLVFPLVEGRTYGWPLWAFGMMAAAAVSLAAFYAVEFARERSGKTQLLPVSLLTNGNFLLGAFMTMLFFSGLPGLFMVLALFFQAGFDFTPLHSGLTTVPFPVGVLIASLIGGRIGSHALRWRLAGGAIVMALGMVFLRFTMAQVGEVVDPMAFVAPLVICGLGLGFAVTAMFQTILSGVPPRDAGSGSGALQAFQQIGAALGVALVGEIFFTWLEHARDWGATSKASAFVNAASNALYYEIAVFLGVALLVPFLKPLPRTQGGWQGQAAAQPPQPIET